MEEKICCLLTDPVTLPIQRGQLRRRLRAGIRRMIKEGCNTFVSTLETELDVLLAQLVLDEAALHYGLRLEAALSCAQDAASGNAVLRSVLRKCSGIAVHGTRGDACACLRRDHAMLRFSDCALAVQPPNEPPHTLEHARMLQKKIYTITL